MAFHPYHIPGVSGCVKPVPFLLSRLLKFSGRIPYPHGNSLDKANLV